jgi:hypothetical protein
VSQAGNQVEKELKNLASPGQKKERQVTEHMPVTLRVVETDESGLVVWPKFGHLPKTVIGFLFDHYVRVHLYTTQDASPS